MLIITPLLLFTNDDGSHYLTIAEVTLLKTMNVFDVMLSYMYMPLEMTICFLRLAMSQRLTLFISLGAVHVYSTQFTCVRQVEELCSPL